MTSLFLTCEIGMAGWQESLRELTAGAEKSVMMLTLLLLLLMLIMMLLMIIMVDVMVTYLPCKDCSVPMAAASLATRSQSTILYALARHCFASGVRLESFNICVMRRSQWLESEAERPE